MVLVKRPYRKLHPSNAKLTNTNIQTTAATDN